MYTAHVHFFTNLDLFCIDNARVIYRKIWYITQRGWHNSKLFSVLLEKEGSRWLGR